MKVHLLDKNTSFTLCGKNSLDLQISEISGVTCRTCNRLIRKRFSLLAKNELNASREKLANQ